MPRNDQEALLHAFLRNYERAQAETAKKASVKGKMVTSIGKNAMAAAPRTLPDTGRALPALFDAYADEAERQQKAAAKEAERQRRAAEAAAKKQLKEQKKKQEKQEKETAEIDESINPYAASEKKEKNPLNNPAPKLKKGGFINGLKDFGGALKDNFVQGLKGGALNLINAIDAERAKGYDPDRNLAFRVAELMGQDFTEEDKNKVRAEGDKINRQILERNEAFARANAEKNKDREGFGAKTGQLLGSGLGGMVPTMAAGIVSPITASQMAYAQGVGGSYGDALADGATAEQAYKAGVGGGAATAAIEALTGGIPMAGEGIIPVGELASRYAKSKAGKMIVNRLAEATGEGAEEVIENYVMPVIERATYKDEIEWPTLQENLDSFLSAALASTALGTAVEDIPTLRRNAIQKPMETVQNEPVNASVEEADTSVTEQAEPIVEPAVEPTANPMAELVAQERPAPTNRGVTYVGSKPLPFTYAVFDVDQLIPSNGLNGDINPAYPSELQPRDRTREGSKAQISRMSAELVPDLLGESATAQNGAPIVRSDGAVIGGNGRTLAIKQAYDSGAANAYSNYVRENAARFGIDPETVPEHPVLVRVADDGGDYAQLARDLNASTTAAYSATETGASDANKLDDSILSLLVPSDDGGINTSGNADFVRAFLTRVVPESERGEMVDSAGELSKNGLQRIEYAVFAKAYGDTRLLEKLSESLDNDSKNLTNALLATAPRAVAVQNAMRQDSLYNIDVVPSILQAVELYNKSKSEKITIDNAASQISMDGFQYDGGEVFLAKAISAYKNSGKKLKELFSSVYDSLESYGDPNQLSLFGETSIPTLETVMEGAADNYGKIPGVDPGKLETPDFGTYPRRTNQGVDSRSRSNTNPLPIFASGDTSNEENAKVIPSMAGHPNTVGSKEAKYGYQEAPTQMNALRGQDEANLTNHPMLETYGATDDTHQVIHREQTEELAKQRLETENPVEFLSDVGSRIKNSGTVNSEELATLFEIRSRLQEQLNTLPLNARERRTAAAQHAYITNLIKDANTEGARALNYNQRFSTPERAVDDAARVVSNAVDTIQKRSPKKFDGEVQTIEKAVDVAGKEAEGAAARAFNKAVGNIKPTVNPAVQSNANTQGNDLATLIQKHIADHKPKAKNSVKEILNQTFNASIESPIQRGARPKGGYTPIEKLKVIMHNQDAARTLWENAKASFAETADADTMSKIENFMANDSPDGIYSSKILAQTVEQVFKETDSGYKKLAQAAVFGNESGINQAVDYIVSTVNPPAQYRDAFHIALYKTIREDARYIKASQDIRPATISKAMKDAGISASSLAKMSTKAQNDAFLRVVDNLTGGLKLTAEERQRAAKWLWKNYNERVSTAEGKLPTDADLLGSRVENRATDNVDIDYSEKVKRQKIVVDEMYKAAVESGVVQGHRQQNKLTAAQKLHTLLEFRDKPNATLKAAQQQLREKYKNDPKMLERIDSFLNSDAIFSDQTLARALLDEVKDYRDATGKPVGTFNELMHSSAFGNNEHIDRVVNEVIRQVAPSKKYETQLRSALYAEIGKLSAKRNPSISDNKVAFNNAARALKIDPRKLCRMSQAKKHAAFEAIVNKALEGSFTPAETKAKIVDSVEAEFDNALANAAEKNLKQMFPDKTRSATEQRDQFLDLLRMGLYNTDSVKQLAATKFGINPLTNEQTQEIMDLMEQAEQLPFESHERVNLETKAAAIAASQVNSSFVDKWDAWRYTSMLGNIRTNNINDAGNISQGLMARMKEVSLATIEATVDGVSKALGGKGIDRTTSVVNMFSSDGRQLLAAAAADMENNAYRRLTGTSERVNLARMAPHERRIFKNNFLEKGRNASGASMEVADVYGVPGSLAGLRGWTKGMDKVVNAVEQADAKLTEKGIIGVAGLRNNYAWSLAEYLKANGKDASIFQSQDPADIALLERARAHAIEQAQRNTYHEENELANKITAFKRSLRESNHASVRLAGKLMEGFVPFVATPMNLGREALRTNPITGGASAVVHLGLAATGKADINVALDRMASSLTGAALVAIGAELFRKGLLTASVDDDDRVKSKMEGKDAFSLHLMDDDGKMHSYTVSWLSAAAIPMFVGAELANFKEVEASKKAEAEANGEVYQPDSKLNAAYSAATNILGPLLDTTMLQSLNNTLSTVRSSDKNSAGLDMLGGMAMSYFTQGIPTLAGQAARTIDPVRRSNYTGATGLEKTIKGAVTKAENKLPFLSKTNEPFIDYWGQEQVTPGNGLERAAYNFLSPGFVSEGGDEVDQRLVQLAEKVGNNEVLPSYAPSALGSGDSSHRMTPEEYTEFSRQYGQTNRKLAEAALDQIPEEHQEKLIPALYDVSKAIAARDVIGKAPNKSDAKAIAAYDTYGVDGLVQWLLYKEVADLDGNGSIKKQEAEHTLKYSPLTSEQKKFFLALTHDGW